MTVGSGAGCNGEGLGARRSAIQYIPHSLAVG